MAERLADQFAALDAERARSWDPDKLARNRAQRRDLVARFDRRGVAQPGDRLEPYTLIDTDGAAFGLDTLVRSSPAVLIFFRYGECPACNIALPYYDRQLAPALAGAGVPLIAVSPQLPDRLKAFRERTGIQLPIASDPDGRLARRLGISFVPDDIPDGPPPPGWIGELTGTESWELPQPSVLVLERDLTVRSLTVSPDWLDRPEAADILRDIAEASASIAA
jgi:peroxiredoxin